MFFEKNRIACHLQERHPHYEHLITINGVRVTVEALIDMT
jgi:hypothetical protein